MVTFVLTFLLSYERLKTYSQTSAQEIGAILGHFIYPYSVFQFQLDCTLF